MKTIKFDLILNIVARTDAELVEALIDSITINHPSRVSPIFTSNEWLKQHYIDGMTLSDIAKRGGVSKSAASANKRTALKHLYIALTKNEDLCEQFGLRIVKIQVNRWYGPDIYKSLYLKDVEIVH